MALIASDSQCGLRYESVEELIGRLITYDANRPPARAAAAAARPARPTGPPPRRRDPDPVIDFALVRGPTPTTWTMPRPRRP